jgi:hypothetical protein
MMPDFSNLVFRGKLKKADWLANWRLLRLARQLTANARPKEGVPPVIFFNASTRLVGISLNAAFATLAASGLQVAGVPVIYFGCQAGMSRCVLGTDGDEPAKLPPCGACTSQARWLFSHAPAVWFSYQEDRALAAVLDGMNLARLMDFTYQETRHNFPSIPIPFGSLVLPSLRWALRRHDLQDDDPTRFLYRQYILSAHRIVDEFATLLDRVEPSAAVLFNGQMYPEATARWVAMQRGVRVVTHEVGFRPFSAFFTDQEATAYPIDIPEEFDLDAEQNARLDRYLEQRFQGNFTMAGIRFWPEMNNLGGEFAEKARGFKQVVAVFTNVVFDTSQTHANTIYPHMFAWLEDVKRIILDHPETLFVIRAHLDELRPGKESHETVQDWVTANCLTELPNVLFIPSQEYLSSYDLIGNAKFVMVYNSSIGLEAALLGAPVLCAGKARYTRYPTVFFPQSPALFRKQAEEFLASAAPLDVPPEFKRNARRFLYYQLFKASLPFDAFLEKSPRPGFVRLRLFHWEGLSVQRSATMQVIVNGILKGNPFLLDEEPA